MMASMTIFIHKDAIVEDSNQSFVGNIHIADSTDGVYRVKITFPRWRFEDLYKALLTVHHVWDYWCMSIGTVDVFFTDYQQVIDLTLALMTSDWGKERFGGKKGA